MKIKFRETYSDNVKKPMLCGLINVLHLIYIILFVPNHLLHIIPIICSIQYHYIDIVGYKKFQQYIDYIGLLSSQLFYYDIQFYPLINFFIIIETIGFIYLYDHILRLHYTILGLNMLYISIIMEHSIQYISLLISQILVGLWIIFNPVNLDDLVISTRWTNHETFHLLILIVYIIYSYLFLL